MVVTSYVVWAGTGASRPPPWVSPPPRECPRPSRRCHLASSSLGSSGGYMDLTTSSTLPAGMALTPGDTTVMVTPRPGAPGLPLSPGADAFGHHDDVTQAGGGLHPGARAHGHGHQLLCQRVADLLGGLGDNGSGDTVDSVPPVPLVPSVPPLPPVPPPGLTFRMAMQWDTRPLGRRRRA